MTKVGDVEMTKVGDVEMTSVVEKKKDRQTHV